MEGWRRRIGRLTASFEQAGHARSAARLLADQNAQDVRLSTSALHSGHVMPFWHMTLLPVISASSMAHPWLYFVLALCWPVTALIVRRQSLNFQVTHAAPLTCCVTCWVLA